MKDEMKDERRTCRIYYLPSFLLFVLVGDLVVVHELFDDDDEDDDNDDDNDDDDDDDDDLRFFCFFKPLTSPYIYVLYQLKRTKILPLCFLSVHLPNAILSRFCPFHFFWCPLRLCRESSLRTPKGLCARKFVGTHYNRTVKCTGK